MTSFPKSRVAERWGVNASPVIALARIGQVALLTRLPEESVLPRAVADELQAAPPEDPARQAVESGLFRVVETPAPSPVLIAWDLGRGETAVLAYALANPGWVAMLDDGAARRCARSLSLALTGTLAVVILAKQHGLIESAAQVLLALRQAEFRLEDALVRKVLARTVNEVWPPA